MRYRQVVTDNKSWGIWIAYRSFGFISSLFKGQRTLMYTTNNRWYLSAPDTSQIWSWTPQGPNLVIRECESYTVGVCISENERVVNAEMRFDFPTPGSPTYVRKRIERMGEEVIPTITTLIFLKFVGLAADKRKILLLPSLLGTWLFPLLASSFHPLFSYYLEIVVRGLVVVAGAVVEGVVGFLFGIFVGFGGSGGASW